MRKFAPGWMALYRNDTLMLSLTAISLFSGLVLVGLYFYSGTFFPSVRDGASASEAAMKWLIWGLVAAVPALTSVLWVLRLLQKESADAE